MYSIYSFTNGNKVCIHDDLVADETVKVLDPKLKLVDSGAGSLQFKLAPNNVAYGNYDVTETKVLGIVNDGAPVDVTSSLVSGGINQNGEEIVDSTAVRTSAIQRENANSLIINGIEANVDYTEYQFIKGIPKESISNKQNLESGYFNLATGETLQSNKVVRFQKKINVEGATTIKVAAHRTNGTALRYGMCMYAGDTFVAYSSDMASGTTYTLPTNHGQITHIWIWIKYEDGGQSISVKEIHDSVYVYKDDVGYALIPATQNSREWSSESCAFINSYIPVSGSATRAYYKLDFKPAVDVDGSSFESGTVAIESGKTVLAESTTQVRFVTNLSQSPWFFSSSDRVTYRIVTETESGKELVVTAIYANGYTSGFNAYNATINNGTIQDAGGFSFCWFIVRYADNSTFDASDITSFRLEFIPTENAYIGGTACLYNAQGDPEDYYYLRTGGNTGYSNDSYVDIQLESPGQTTATNVALYFRRMTKAGGGAQINQSELSSLIDSIEIGYASPINYEVFQYDSNGTYIGTSGVIQSGAVSLLDTCTSYKVVLRYVNLDDILPSDVAEALIQKQVISIQEEHKSVDLVGRLTSTIRVNRSSWGVTEEGNGTFNVLAAQSLASEFEQGWYRIGPGVNGNPYNSDLAVRSKNKIQVQLSTDDYISVNASIRGTGKESEKTPADSSTSSTYRRPCGYVLYFYNGDTCLGVLGSQNSPIPANSDVQVPYDDVDGVKICIRPIAAEGEDFLYITDLDFVTLYSTKSSIVQADVSASDGELVYEYGTTAYTLTTKKLELTNTVVEATNTWTARINAQSRQGLAFTWGVAMYKANGEFIGMQRWLDQDSRFDGLRNGTKFIRIILKYKGVSSDPYGIELPPNDVSVLNVTCTKVSNTRVETLLWEGRVLSEDVDFKNCRVIYCEGDLAYLNDTRQAPRVYTNITFRNYISKLIAEHNSKVSPERRFVLGETWEPTKKKDDTYGQSDPEENITTHTTNFETTLELLNALVTDFGGHLRVRRTSVNDVVTRTIDWLEKYPRKSNQTIKFGENLLDFTRKYDMSKMCTAVYPTGEVLVQAKSSAVGEHVSKDSSVWSVYNNTLLYQGEDGRVYMQQGSNLSGYQTVIATVDTSTVSDIKSYYFSCRLHGGFVACFITDSGNNIYSGCIERAGSDYELGFVDYIDKEIQIPPGANKVWICNFGNAIPIALKKQTKEVEGLDKLLTIEEVNTDKDSSGKVWHTKGSPYITNPEAVEKYGWIEHRLDLPNVKTKTDLYNAAKTYLKDSQFEEMTLEVSAVDLNSLGVNAEFIDILDEVRVISEPHGLDKYFPASEIDIPLNNPAGQNFKFGNKSNIQLTSQNVSTNTELLQKIEKAPSTESVIRTAFANAADAINAATKGSYINYIYDNDGHMCELVISDAPPAVPDDVTTIPITAGVWRWNQAGLAHSSHGYNLTEFNTNVAITAAGQVIADQIIGSFIHGYTIGSGKIIVGSGVPGTSSAAQALGPPGVSNYISIRNNSAGDHPYMDFFDGIIHFGMLRENSSRDEFGQISGKLSITQDSGGTHDGLLISSSGLLVIDTPDLGIGNGTGIENVAKTYSGSFSVGDKTLYFRNGMLYHVDTN